MVNDLKRWRFWRRFFTHFFSALGLVSAVAGITALVLGTLPSEYIWIAWLAIMVAIAYGAVVAWPRPIEASFHAPNTKIQVVRGDLFEQGTHLVIGTCDTFDTAFPYISPKSVQGAYLSRVYGGDHGLLDSALNDQLVSATVEI